jgi:hypothetical protein
LQRAKTQQAYNQYDEFGLGSTISDFLESSTGGISPGYLISPNSAEVETVYSFFYSSTNILL